MRIDIITLFSGMFEGPFSHSIVRRAQEKGALEIGFIDPRDFARDRRKTVDDRPYGGGPGMVLMAEPLYKAIRKVRRRGSFLVHLTPRGKPLDQALARKLAGKKHLILLCGHYEGIDERAAAMASLEVSLGDFVLTGGEIPAMALTDAVTRLLPGVLKKEEATRDESFTAGLLEPPQYTRPRVWKRKKVPAVLLTGDHSRIRAWRLKAALAATKKKRPDLLRK